MTKPPDRRKEITAHYMCHWGVPSHIYARPNHVADLAVIEFPPRSDRAFYCYATNGMSAYPQNRNNTVYGTELFATSQTSAKWIIILLDALARYPLTQETSLAEFDTIDCCRPIDPTRSSFTAVLLAPPAPPGTDTLGLIGRNDAALLFVHQVVGIYAAECTLAQQQGGRVLWERLVDSHQTLLMDGLRIQVS